MRRTQRRLAETPMGYAAAPGTGPEGETCLTCVHSMRLDGGRSFWKCRAVERKWTRSRHSDILMKSPAYLEWAPDPMVSDDA